MSKRKSAPTAAVASDYDSDGGFVEDAPRSKKAKNGGAKGAKDAKEKAGKGGQGTQAAGGKAVAGGGQVGKDGEEFWELTSKRRIGISEFKGKHMISIREFYEKDGEVLPTKKGISLPIEQLNTLIKLLPHVETVLAEKGQRIDRPDYSGAGASAAVDEDDEEEEEEVKGKQNFEETSEDE